MSSSADLFQILTFSKQIFQEHYRSIKRFGSRSELDRRSVGPDVSPDCSQRLLAGDKSRHYYVAASKDFFNYLFKQYFKRYTLLAHKPFYQVALLNTIRDSKHSIQHYTHIQIYM